MKNKKNIYILLPIVIIIWGMVIYTFFSFTSPETDVVEAPANYSLKPLEVKKKDTFSINVNYRDPFLGKMHQPQTTVKKLGRKTIKKPEEIITWPNVIYRGIVSDNKEKKKVFMVMINGQTYFMKEKDIQQEVILKSGDRKAIVMQYKGTQNIIEIRG